ncbi:MAG: hypothetical protein AAF741_19600 [Bacteroidota bacterium]
MKNLFVLTFFLLGTTVLSAQTELDLNTFFPETHDLGERCFYVKGRQQNLKTLRNIPKESISRVLEATAEEATQLFIAYGLEPDEVDCAQGLLWVEMLED